MRFLGFCEASGSGGRGQPSRTRAIP